ncbi:ABC transporter permease subunit [Streptomyces chumphonensis]|uniref:ABC transporter permease n=1 Tax=Streptomyces chumphonensis TaxID=1214925 RepID=A0A927F2S8_9ACTN|nr:ABC transporter permease [Streptomyces chumphonensis]MBD3934166.1 ABC transporter permease [Streptomyces chumphonensis]
MSTPYAAPQAAPAAPGPHGGVDHRPARPVEQSTHLGHAIASEWTKIRSVRSTIWTLAVMFALVVGIGLLTALALESGPYAELPVLGGGLFGMMLGQLAIITLGVLTVTSEYSTGMIRTTMTVCPKRTRVLTAKAIVFFALTFVMTLAATSLTALIHSAMLEGKPLSPYHDLNVGADPSQAVETATATSQQWLQATVGVSLFVALLGLLSLAVGTLLRSTPGGVTTMLGLVLLPFLISLFLMTESTRELGDALREYSMLNGLSTLYHMPFEFTEDASQVNGWPLLGLLAAVTAAALIAAYARISTRDV